MTDSQRSIWDDLADIGREILDKLDEALHPEKKRQLARVPVPIHGKRRHPDSR